MPLKKTDRVLRNATILLGLLCMSVGCGPANLNFLLAPFVDDKVPANKYKLANPDKEVTVVVASRFETLEIRPVVQDGADVLGEALAYQLRTRFKENREKVKVISPLQSRPHFAKLKEWSTENMLKVGEHFKADYVISLNVQSMSLMLPNSYNEMYQGHADLEVVLYDVQKGSKELADAVVVKELMRREYPTRGPVPVSEKQPRQFLNDFTSRLARDLARWFTAYPSDERFDID